MFKRLIVSFIYMVLLSFNLSAQFFTLKPVEKPTFRIIKPSEKQQETIGENSSKSNETNDSQSTESYSSNEIDFSLPLNCPLVVNSQYGLRIDPFSKKSKFHRGVDLSAKGNTAMSILTGKVKKTGYERKGLGNYVTLSYGNFELTYGHLASVLVSKKDIVRAGTPIGITGNTGRSTGEHLHLSLKVKGKTVDPMPFLLFIQKRASKQ